VSAPCPPTLWAGAGQQIYTLDTVVDALLRALARSIPVRVMIRHLQPNHNLYLRHSCRTHGALGETRKEPTWSYQLTPSLPHCSRPGAL
jgi:hypothetical protein